MREDPRIDVSKISVSLEVHYGLRVASVAFLAIGYDPNAAVYEVVSGDGRAYFLKVRFGPVHEPGLLVPRALVDRGIRNVIVPLRSPPASLGVAALVLEPHRDPVLGEAPQVLLQPVVELPLPLPGQEVPDRLAPLEELVAVAPLRVLRIRHRHPFGVAAVPRVLGGLDLLLGGLLVERGYR